METEERENRLTPLGVALRRLSDTIQERRAKLSPAELAAEIAAIEAENAASRARQARSNLPKIPEKPITKAQLARLLAPLEVIYNGKQLDEREAQMKYQIFYDVLGNLPESDVARAVRQYLRKTDPPQQFFPKPADLLVLSRW